MAINPGIALGVEAPKPLDMLGAYGKAMSIKELVDGARLRGLQEQQLGQKMQFDQQDAVLKRATGRVDLQQKLAAGLLGVSPEQRRTVWPSVRQQFTSVFGDDGTVSQDYPGDELITAWGTAGGNPDKMRELAMQEAQRLAFMDAQRSVQQPRGMSSAAPGTTGSAGVEMNEDGSANLTAPQVNVRDDVSRMPNPNQMFSLYQLIQQDPRIAGTPIAQQVLENALKLKQEQEQSPSRGMQLIKGEDGQTYVVKNGVREDAIPTGNDPNAQFWRGPEGQPVPNQARIDADLAKAAAGATRVNQFNNPKDDFKNERDLRNDFKSEPIYKAYQEVKTAYGQIGSSLKLESPAGDLAAATKIMKLLDPTSVVRESELGMAMAATGLEDRLSSLATNIIRGTKLTPAQRKDFRRLADEIYLISEKEYGAKRSEYMDTAKAYGLSEERVGGKEKPSAMGSQANPYKIKGDDGYGAIPSGSFYTGPDGVLRRKP
jgi:hypothetical protein